MASSNRKFLTDIIGMQVVSTNGDLIGKLSNVVVDSERGQILSILVQPDRETVNKSFQRDKDGLYNIPVTMLASIEDYVVIDSKKQ
ncbi:MAG: PRC-barrel domain-containing protein [Candidatus Thermoplasmatota archaeon]|nr:PRC-barrel domain-containing protein [Candidatus Thermoplasmatota archaeon]MCL5730835.1 PRC-barrel domain-containing protein [Candidatus Thermoplasmatota archaeon]